jgi:hypothetical protein
MNSLRNIFETPNASSALAASALPYIFHSRPCHRAININLASVSADQIPSCALIHVNGVKKLYNGTYTYQVSIQQYVTLPN